MKAAIQRLVSSEPKHIAMVRPQLGDILQRLAMIAPHDLYAIACIARDALKRAEAEFERNRRRAHRYVILLPALVSLVACGNDSAPSKAAPACQSNNTAIITFENRTTNRTHDLYLDNGKIALLGPGQTSQPVTVAAAVQHSVVWFYTNTSLAACVVNPIPATCSTTHYFCSF